MRVIIPASIVIVAFVFLFSCSLVSNTKTSRLSLLVFFFHIFVLLSLCLNY